MIRKSWILLFVLLIAGASPSAGASEYGVRHPEAQPVSMAGLLGGDLRLHGEVVRTVGILHIEDEVASLYFTREHFDGKVYENAIWLTFDFSVLGGSSERLFNLNGRYVILEGVFNRDRRGAKGLFAGTIEMVNRIAIRSSSPSLAAGNAE